VSAAKSYVNPRRGARHKSAPPRRAGRMLPALTLVSSSAIDAFGWSADSPYSQSIRRDEETMSIVLWIVLGLTAGFTGAQLVRRKGRRLLPDLLLGVLGALAGGWSYYTLGPDSVTGFNLTSLLAAVCGSLVFLLIYYALRRS
jgi:uncharacterized membrane protein YeaQ/YmgE (transglycosylase-associated protein family)